MKSYLITNPAPVYVRRIREFIERPRRGRGQRQDENGNVIVRKLESGCIVSSREEFENESFKKAFYNAGAHTVFIVPELSWGRHDRIDAGYRVAMELLEGKLKVKFFNLVFVSFYRRDQLRRMVGPEFSEMVNAFPHLTLDSLQDPRTEMPAAYSDIQFELVKRTVVSRSGRVDYLLHTLADLDKVALESAKGRIGPILEVLSLPAYGGEDAGKKEALAALKESYDEMFTEEEVRQCGEQLRLYLNRLKSEFATRSGVPDQKLGYSVLIIEDDDVFRTKMRDFFKERFTKVDAWTPADIRLARKKIADSVRAGDGVEDGKYDLILIDLLFTESGRPGDYLLPFNGLDLLGDLRLAESRVISERGTVRHAAVRIVSALPRDVISRLVGMHKGMESPAVFTKGGGWEQLQGSLIDRMDEMVKECEYYRVYHSYLKTVNRPRQGIFVVPGVLEALLADRATLDSAIRKGRNIVENHLQPDMKTSLLSPGKLSAAALTDKEKLESVMFHRQLVINYLRNEAEQREGNYVFEEEGYRPYAEMFGIKLEHYDTGYLTTKLGFELSKASKTDSDGDQFIRCINRNDEGQFIRCINLNDRKQFFDGELDGQSAGVVSNLDTQNMVNQATGYLRGILSQDEKRQGKLSDIFKAAGVTRHLDVGPSAESFLQMLRDVHKYLTTKGTDEDDQFDLWSVFDDLFADVIGQVDNPDLRIQIRNSSQEMDDLIDAIRKIFRM